MRMMVVLSAGAALMTAGVAGAQGGPGAGYPPPGAMGPGPMTHGSMDGGRMEPPLPPQPMRSSMGGPQQWGSQVDGRWWGGVNAPGGPSGYRQPYRGYRVPGYWVSPRFSVTDYGYYGLPRPTGGYRWARYYDDAVMIDRGGSVGDYRSGVDWDGRYDERRRSSGVGGAVAGAVVGGIVGNVVAGRGDRLTGTLIGAGVGGAAGYAVDHSRTRRGPPPGAYRDEYRGKYRDGSTGYDRGGSDYPGWASGDGRTTVVTSDGYDGYGGGYPIVSAPYGYAAGGSVTTVTIGGASTVTTTTTEIIEDSVGYSRPVARKVYRKRVYHARPRVRARCGCGS